VNIARAYSSTATPVQLRSENSLICAGADVNVWITRLVSGR
jgi:hypothetical protein